MPSSKKQTATTDSSPWAPAQAGLKDVLSKAQSLSGDTNLFTPEFGSTSQQGLDALKAVGQQGSAAVPAIENVVGGATGTGFNAGLQTLTATAGGSGREVNPYLQSVLDAANEDVANRVNQQFSAAGRYGSGAYTGVLAKELGDITTGALFSNYNNERDRELAAAGTLYGGGFQGAAMAPQLDLSRLFGAQTLGQAGGIEDSLATAQKQAPLRATEWQAGLTTPIAGLGGTSTATQETPSNRFGQILGAGTMGLGLLTGNPMMMAGGAGGMTGGGSSFGSLAMPSRIY